MATKALPTCIRTLACTTYKEKKRITYKKMGGGGCDWTVPFYEANIRKIFWTRVYKEDTWVVLQWRIAISFQILRHLIEIRGRFVKK